MCVCGVCVCVCACVCGARASGCVCVCARAPARDGVCACARACGVCEHLWFVVCGVSVWCVCVCVCVCVGLVFEDPQAKSTLSLRAVCSHPEDYIHVFALTADSIKHCRRYAKAQALSAFNNKHHREQDNLSAQQNHYVNVSQSCLLSFIKTNLIVC